MAKKKKFADLAKEIEALAKKIYQLQSETSRRTVGNIRFTEKCIDLFNEIDTLFKETVNVKVSKFFKKHPDHPYLFVVKASCERVMEQVEELRYTQVMADLAAINGSLGLMELNTLQTALYTLALSTDQVANNLRKLK